MQNETVKLTFTDKPIPAKPSGQTDPGSDWPTRSKSVNALWKVLEKSSQSVCHEKSRATGRGVASVPGVYAPLQAGFRRAVGSWRWLSAAVWPGRHGVGRRRPRRGRRPGGDARAGLAGRPPVAAGPLDAKDGRYPTAMTAMAGIALLCEGSTTTQGKYAANIRRAVDYLVSRSRPNGLIGDPHATDDRYTYGHGFSMLFLSQVLGEEEDVERREQLVDVLTRAVVFTGQAQTEAGGWGYVSAKDGSDFDEGSTTITQVQGLRGCRNAGIPVPKEIIDKADQLHPQVHHGPTAACSTTPRAAAAGRRSPPRPSPACSTPATTTTSTCPSCWTTASENLDDICQRRLRPLALRPLLLRPGAYREGGKTWDEYRDKIYARLVSEADPDGSWNQGYIGPVYTTAINLTILQLDNAASAHLSTLEVMTMDGTSLLMIDRPCYRRTLMTDNASRTHDTAAIEKLGDARQKILDQLAQVIVGQNAGDRGAVDLAVQPRALPAGRRAGAGQDADDQHAQPHAEPHASAASSSRPT